jgi:hypothetical protein
MGINSQAGCYGYSIIAIDMENKTFTLDSVENINVNDEYSC